MGGKPPDGIAAMLPQHPAKAAVRGVTRIWLQAPTVGSLKPHYTVRPTINNCLPGVLMVDLNGAAGPSGTTA
jgi:hypothetical protein